MVPTHLFPDLSAEDLEGSWYALMADRYGIDIISGTAQVVPACPTPARPNCCASAEPAVLSHPDAGARPAGPDRRVRRDGLPRRLYTITVELLPNAGSRPGSHP